jgi:hypothetical protein
VEEAEAAAAEGERRWREYKRRLLLRRSQTQSSWYLAERGKVSALVGGLRLGKSLYYIKAGKRCASL